MGNQYGFNVSFEDWCKETGKIWWLDAWNYEKNNLLPSEVAMRSGKKYYFKCPYGCDNHQDYCASLINITNPMCATTKETYCTGCNSIGAYIDQEYGHDYLQRIWSDKNPNSPYANRCSTSTVWFKCVDDSTHPDYEVMGLNIMKSINCPYCSGKKVCYTNSVGYKYPKIISKWSNKNNQSPFDFTCGSNKKVYLICENGIHNDYPQKIVNAVRYDFRCPICGRHSENKRGANAPNWKGGITQINKSERKSEAYVLWRNETFRLDEYTCQCCLRKSTDVKLNVHHINDFANHPDQRTDLLNGITLCVDCHENTYIGSLHNLYGTRNITPDVLVNYINARRSNLGINIPFDLFEYQRQKEMQIEEEKIMAYERQCIVCGATYRYCSNCSEFAHMEPWHNLYHDGNCRALFNICSKYTSGKLSADEAKAQLDAIQMPSLKVLANGLKKNVVDIMSNASKKEPEQMVDDVKDEQPTEDQKMRFRNKRNRIVNED